MKKPAGNYNGELAHLGKVLKIIRLAKGLSLRDVERKGGISNAFLSQIEMGKGKNMTIKRFIAVANAYQIAPLKLFSLILKEGEDVDIA